MSIISLVIFVPDITTLGAGVCNCDVPCTRRLYDAILSSSRLDSYKIRDEIKSHGKSTYLLTRYQESLDIASQVGNTFAP